MKEFKVHYEEVISYDFYIDAESVDAVPAAFEAAEIAQELSFDRGDVVIGHITEVTDPDGQKTTLAKSWQDYKSIMEDSDTEKPSLLTRIYLIAYIRSDSIGMTGRESEIWSDANPKRLIKKAYTAYTHDFKLNKERDELDDMTEDPVSYREFAKSMTAGFDGRSDLVLIQCTGHHIQFEASALTYACGVRIDPFRIDEREGLPTNREYLIKTLADPSWIDDGGASYDSWLNYNISCPYMSGDDRAHCHGKPDDYICWDNCNVCKEAWLDQEVDV
ncbi:MAG: hypothetical protein IJJ16_03795 [Mogibacterium sp.]|nr:hypothetical protein [Mogibacterium sp.]